MQRGAPAQDLLLPAPWYCDKRPARCLQVAPKELNEKRRATQRVHDKFIGGLEGYNGPPYWKTMNMFPDSVKRGQGVESIVCLFDMLLACCSVPSFLLDFSNAWLGRQGMVGARRLIGEGGKREGKGRVKGRLGVRPVNAVRLSRLIYAVNHLHHDDVTSQKREQWP